MAQNFLIDDKGRMHVEPHVDCQFRFTSESYVIPIQKGKPSARVIVPKTGGKVVLQLHDITPCSDGKLIAQKVVLKEVSDPDIPLIGTARRIS